MEHQHQAERSVSPVSPVSPLVQPEETAPRIQAERFSLNDHSPIPSSPPPAYLPGPPAYTPRAGPTDPEKAAPVNPPSSRNRYLYILIAAILLIIVIATVSGVAGAKAAKHHESSHLNDTGSSPQFPVNPTKTTPAQKPVTSGNTGVASNDCDDKGPRYTITTGTTEMNFDLKCETVIPSDKFGEAGDQRAKDLNATTVYRFEECMYACAVWNMGVRRENGQLCTAVTYYANLTEALGGGGMGNCYLKDSFAKDGKKTNDALVASAVLGLSGTGQNAVDERRIIGESF